MDYMLGIDLGAASCAVGVRRGTQVEPCAVGEHATTMPAVALRRADGTVFVGEEADRRGPHEPMLVGRPGATPLGEPAPTAVDSHGWGPLGLTRALLSALIERAAGRPGDRPDHVVLTYPLRGGEEAAALLDQAAVGVTGRTPALVPEPIAAVAGLAHQRDLDVDTTLAVVDVGGSSTDVALVCCTATSFDLVGEPTSVSGLGGPALDAAVLAVVESAIGDVTSLVMTADRADMPELWRLTASCRRAKERLSYAPAAVVEVPLGHTDGQVEITREAFERAAEPDLVHVADLVTATVDRAGLSTGDLAGVLLTGGTARVPLLARLLGDRTGLEVLTTDQPEVTTALGAAALADLVPGAAATPTDDAAPRIVGAGGSSPVDVVPDAADPVPGTGDVDDSALSPVDIGPPGVDDGPIPPFDLDERGPIGVPFGDPVADTGEIVGAPVTDAPMAAAPVPNPEPGAWWPEPDPVDAGSSARWEAPPWSDDDRGELETPDGPGSPANPWEDTRTSVFDPPPEPDPEAAVATDDSSQFSAWSESRHEEVRPVSTSDTDPFGVDDSSLRHRHRRHGDASASDHDDHERRPVVAEHHLVIGAVAAAVMLLIISGYAFLSGADNADDVEMPIANGTLSTTTTTGIATTVSAPTTGPSAETADQPAGDEPADATTTSDEPTTPSAPPALAGDTTPPPTTPSTTSTPSSSTSAPASTTSSATSTPSSSTSSPASTTSSTTTTRARSTSPPPSTTPSTTVPPGNDSRNDDGGGLLDLLGLG